MLSFFGNFNVSGMVVFKEGKPSKNDYRKYKITVENLFAKYKSNTTKVAVNSTNYTLTKNSNNGEYDQLTVDTSSTKTVDGCSK